MSKKMTDKERRELIDRVWDSSTENDMSEAEKRYIAMINGEKPRNEEEAIMQREIIQMRKEGKIIDIPSM
jgi:ribonuclease HII